MAGLGGGGGGQEAGSIYFSVPVDSVDICDFLPEWNTGGPVYSQD